MSVDVFGVLGREPPEPRRRRYGAPEMDDTGIPGLRITPVDDFASVEEQGADALLGTSDDALIPEYGDVMVYGDGGAGKTTLAVDMGFHLGAGDPGLGIAVPAPVRVLLIENEGPRPLFRRKLKRKLDAWKGSPIYDRVSVFDEPWGQFTFREQRWRSKLAATVRDHEIGVLIVGPVTRTGMHEAGTLQEVRDFLALVAEVRRESGRRLTVILVHHENKGGAVSGAWEGSGDTLLHVESRGNGHTCMKVEKARWSSTHHGTTLDLVWTEGEGFAVEGERDYHAEIEALLADGAWRTAKEIAHKDTGIGASEATVKEKLAERPDSYISRRGSEVGRHRNATVYGLHSGQNADDADAEILEPQGRVCTTAFPLGEAVGEDADARAHSELHLGRNADAPDDWSDEELQALVDACEEPEVPKDRSP